MEKTDLSQKKKKGRHGISFYLCVSVFLLAAFMLFRGLYQEWKAQQQLKEQQEQLVKAKETDAEENINIKKQVEILTAGAATVLDQAGNCITTDNTQEPVILPEYQELYEQNHDLIGWLSIEGTVIDYPVMQTPWDENFYLTRGFDLQENKNGCLILDTDSVAGIGTKEQNYKNGIEPSTNLIIHGHTMKSGQMFGNLKLYQDEEYGTEHSVICFDSLYEKRKYELIAVFYSQVFYEDEDVFKYYKFFQADTEEEFDDWYSNIKKMSLYDTGVTAQFGDEFITLSCCAYHVEDGRFVVVGKRIPEMEQAP